MPKGPIELQLKMEEEEELLQVASKKEEEENGHVLKEDFVRRLSAGRPVLFSLPPCCSAWCSSRRPERPRDAVAVHAQLEPIPECFHFLSYCFSSRR